MIGLTRPVHLVNGGTKVVRVTNHFLIRSKACSTTWKSTLALIPEPRTRAAQVMGPRRESTILLKWTWYKYWLPVTCYTRRVGHLSTLIGEASFCSRRRWRCRQLVTVQRIHTRGQNSHPSAECLYSSARSGGPGIIVNEGAERALKSRICEWPQGNCFLDRAGQLDIRTHSSGDGTHKTCGSSSQRKSKSGDGRWAWSLTPSWGAVGS